jgi:hypothetical protein
MKRLGDRNPSIVICGIRLLGNDGCSDVWAGAGFCKLGVRRFGSSCTTDGYLQEVLLPDRDTHQEVVSYRIPNELECSPTSISLHHRPNVHRKQHSQKTFDKHRKPSNTRSGTHPNSAGFSWRNGQMQWRKIGMLTKF